MAAKLKNLDKLKRRFRKIGPAIRAEVSKALDDSADILVAQMKAEVPVDDGDLKDSIRKTREPGRKSRYVKQSAAQAAGEKDLYIRVVAGGKEFWAIFAEFGTVHHPATPFFYPVYRANLSRLKSRISRAVKRGQKKGAA